MSLIEARKALKKRIVSAVKDSRTLLDDMRLAEKVGEKRKGVAAGQILSPLFSSAIEDLISDGLLRRSRRAGGGKEVLVLGNVPDSYFQKERVVQAAYEPPMTIRIDPSFIDPSLKREAVRAAAAKSPANGKREIVKIRVPKSLLPERSKAAPQPVAAQAATISAPVATAVVSSTSGIGQRGRSFAQIVDDLNTAWNIRIGAGRAFTLLKVTNSANAPSVGGNSFKSIYAAMSRAIADMAAANWDAEQMKQFLDWPRKAATGHVEITDSASGAAPERRSKVDVEEDLCQAWRQAIDRGAPFCRSEIMRAARYRHGSHPLMVAMDVAIAVMKSMDWSPKAMAAHRDLKSVTGVSGMAALEEEIQELRAEIAKLQEARVLPSAVTLLEAEVEAFDAAIEADPENQALKSRRAAVRCAIAALKVSQ